MFELNHRQVNLFIDATFTICPKGFSQCLIITVYLKGYGMYVPFLYCLMQSKKLNSYKQVISQVVSQSDWRIDPITITCDYEKGLIRALTEEFPTDLLTGSNFHFKQAIFRKLKTYGITSISMDSIKKLLGHKIIHLTIT